MAKPFAAARAGRTAQLDPMLVAAAKAYNVGDMTGARGCAEKALKKNPRDWQAAKIAGMAARRSGDPTAAVALFQRALKANEDVETRHEIAATLLHLGRHEDSLPYYERLLRENPGNDLAWNEVGTIFLAKRLVADASACFRRAAAAAPTIAQYHANLAQTAQLSGDSAAVLTELAHCIALEPDNPAWYAMLGKALVIQGREPEAIPVLERALTLAPRHEHALATLAAIEANYDVPRALDHYRQAAAISGHPVYRVLMAMLLPAVPGSSTEIAASRARVDAAVDDLLRDDACRLTLRDLERIPDANFYFAFHGMDDRAILAKISRMYRQLCPDLNWVAPQVNGRRTEGPIRVGFVSMFFFHHSVGIAFRELILRLAKRDGFEVHLVALGQRQAGSDEHQALAAGCARYLAVAADSLAMAREAIAALELDVLIYPDIGMYAFGKFLAHFRLARIQCVMGGHPDTTGIDTIDYYISGELLEPPGADGQYCEKLLRLDRFGVDLWQSSAPEVTFSRAELGIPAGGRTYLCPMKMQKLHPDLDGAIRGILERDPDGWFLVVGDEKYPRRDEQLLARIACSVPEPLMPRVVLLPWISDPRRFFATCATVDAVLDSFPFGSGTTATMLAQAGIPMVTLPGQFARGRGAAALYTLLGVTDIVAPDLDAYCDLAVALARDPVRRNTLGARLRAGCAEAAMLTGAADELACTLEGLCGRRDAR